MLTNEARYLAPRQHFQNVRHTCETTRDLVCSDISTNPGDVNDVQSGMCVGGAVRTWKARRRPEGGTMSRDALKSLTDTNVAIQYPNYFPGELFQCNQNNPDTCLKTREEGSASHLLIKLAHFRYCTSGKCQEDDLASRRRFI